MGMWTKIRKWLMPEIYDDTYFKPHINSPNDVHPPIINTVCVDDDPKPTWPKETEQWSYAEYKKLKEENRKSDDKMAP